MKLYHYLIIFVGLMITLNLAGMALPSGGLVKTIGLVPANYSSPAAGGGVQDIKNSGFYSDLITILTLAAGAAVVASLFSRSAPTSFLKAGLVVTIAGIFFSDMISVYQKLISFGITWITAVSTAIFGVIAVGFMISLIDWWEGGD